MSKYWHRLRALSADQIRFLERFDAREPRFATVTIGGQIHYRNGIAAALVHRRMLEQVFDERDRWLGYVLTERGADVVRLNAQSDRHRRMVAIRGEVLKLRQLDPARLP